MKVLLSHFLSACLGAFFVLILMIGFDKIATMYPLYIPNLFYKEQINYTVNVDSKVTEAVNNTIDNVVQVNNYVGDTLRSTGSGVIYKLTDGDAYIITNHHVVDGASKVEIVTSGGYNAFTSTVRSDPVTDLALVIVPKGEINSVLEFSDSSSLKVGEYVIAIGNPLGLSGSATLGIISNKERLVPVDTDNDNRDDWYATVIQTDAPINPGNSGGALINLDGKLVGINSMKIAEQDVEGIGFSIPANIVSRIIAKLETNETIERPIRLLGITIREVLFESKTAIQIEDVQKNSTASRIGLEKGDVIVKINGEAMRYYFDLKYILSTANSGDTITLTINRNGSEITKEFIAT